MDRQWSRARTAERFTPEIPRFADGWQHRANPVGLLTIPVRQEEAGPAWPRIWQTPAQRELLLDEPRHDKGKSRAVWTPPSRRRGPYPSHSRFQDNGWLTPPSPQSHSSRKARVPSNCPTESQSRRHEYGPHSSEMQRMVANPLLRLHCHQPQNEASARGHCIRHRQNNRGASLSTWTNQWWHSCPSWSWCPPQREFS